MPISTIVVVEDDPSVRSAIQHLLRSAGHDAVTYESAEDFLIVRDRVRVDCLIADVNLPGMSGVALLVALAASGVAMPSILMTGRDDAPTSELVRQAANVPFLRKPFSDRELFDAIELVMAGAKPK